ncbi:MAG TPA: PilZ domain-containing protein [Nitrospirales bacterium]|jgi:hypothetical protein|nr:PilZ domain-containing protein [Nitrospirales bacterium]
MAEEQRFKRLYPRRQVSAPCRVRCQDQLIMAQVVDVSYTGVALVIPTAIELAGKAFVEIPKEIKLQVRPVYNQPVSPREESMEENTQYRIGCKIQLIEQGKRHWTNLCHVVHW